MIYGDYLRNKYHHASVEIADAEGVPCIMEYSKGKNLRNYEIYGNSVQNGTPSPDTPIEIQTVGDLTTKNLFDVNAITSTSGGYVENSVIYVTNYPYSTGITPEKFLEMTGLQEGDTFTTTCEYTQLGVTTGLWGGVTFLSKTSGYSNIDLLVYGNSRSSTIPEGFNSTNYNKMYIYSGKAPEEGDIYGIFRNFAVYKGAYTSDTMPEYEPYHKYDVPITVRGKNLLPNSDWMSGKFSNGFNEDTNVDYITEYTQNSISFNLTAWKGVSSPRFKKDSVKRIIFKINQNQINSDDGYINFYINIEGYDDENNRIGSRAACNNAVADTEYVFDFSAISISNFYKNSTQFSFCIVSRKNAVSNLMVYDIAYYADTDTTEYEPYIGETKHIYLNEPLRKVGDYADYIDFKNQKVVRNILKQSLNAYVIYKKLNNVIRISGWLGRDIKHKYDSHILSTIFNYKLGWSEDIEIIFHHTDNYYNFYWSVYWNRLGLTYDGTNVYRTDDISQTPLADSEIISIANEWLSKLSDKDKEIYIILDTPTEEPISLPTLKTVKGTTIISVDTSIQPSNIKGKYIRT